MNKSLKGNKMYLIGLLPFFLIAFLFEILPLANIVIESFSKTGGNGFTLEHFVKIFTTRLYQQSIFNSLWISIFSALAGIIIAFLGAKAANAASAKVRNIFTSVLNITSNFAGGTFGICIYDLVRKCRYLDLDWEKLWNQFFGRF